jgi:hypothetical protein
MTDVHISDLARQVAQQLGDGWQLNQDREPADWYAEIVRSDGRRLTLQYDRYRAGEKVTISGGHEHRPDISYYELTFGEIGVSVTRGAQVIAQEITRRLLPVYNPAYAEFRERVSSHDAAVEQRNELAHYLSMLLDGKPHGQSLAVSVPDSWQARGTFEPEWGGTVKIELRSVPEQVAVAIAAAVAAASAEVQ